MRTEQEMLDLILETARQDDRIRAVLLNGSRANPNAPRDFFRDFDVIYLVHDVAPFKKNLDWIKCFGEIMIMEMPEDMEDPSPSRDGRFGYLMQFNDGNRIDLGVYPLSKLEDLLRDSLTILLLDKDGRVKSLPAPSEKGYLPVPPTEKAFLDCCNEFWWLDPYVAKGLWREELLYARFMLDTLQRQELMKMLKWYIGMQTGFSINPGKLGKYYRRHLDSELWKLLERTFADSDYDHTWDSLFAMADLFRIIAQKVAGHFGFCYLLDYDQKVTAHLWHVRRLPRTATEIY